jgi:anhydro-N-acetylmuramic acid kinase
MNRNIEQLYQIAQKPARNIIGLMSGTSVDGLDVALCTIQNSGLHTKLTLQHFVTLPYSNYFKQQVKDVFSKQMVDLEQLTLLNAWIGTQHGLMINQCLQQWNVQPTQVDLIASHGQTIYHAPLSQHKKQGFANATLQIGDADHIAQLTGITTIADFRQKHIAHGGEGAPLAVYGDYLIFGKLGEDRLMLNIGGIANFTYLPASFKINEIFSTDIGPGNTLMDQYVQQHFNQYFDENAQIAQKGQTNSQLLHELYKNSFFESAFPKTTGPELFNLDYLQKAQKNSKTEHLSREDVLRTLNEFTASNIVKSVEKCFKSTKNLKIYSSGGGMHNPLVMHYVQQHLPEAQILTTDALQINPDAKEAVLFALLANEAVAGQPQQLQTGRPDIPAVSMGKISFAN